MFHAGSSGNPEFNPKGGGWLTRVQNCSEVQPFHAPGLRVRKNPRAHPCLVWSHLEQNPCVFHPSLPGLCLFWSKPPVCSIHPSTGIVLQSVQALSHKPRAQLPPGAPQPTGESAPVSDLNPPEIAPGNNDQ